MSIAGMYTLPLLLLVSLRGVDSWAMRTVTSYQARVETYAPVWDDDNQVYVSGIPDSVSSGGNLTFDERYRATMDSITTSSIEGALMYLQRDCIDRGSDPTDESVNCERKNNVSVITFLEVQIVQPNVALAEYQEQKYMYPEFCPFVAMEDGECAYADVQDNGDTSSDTIDNVQKASSKYYKNFNAFCKAGNIEFHSYDQDKTLGLNNVTSIPFWESPSSLEANIARTEQTIALYNALADESTNHMQKLPTDLEALRERNPPCYENAEVCYKAQFGCRRHSYAQWHLRHIGGTNRCHLKY
ncbi:hypothetical protein PInf_008919 [Phytophthora infestans]|nr:hypothetical protein PInf_008919 [Phytophthora infestans]